MKQLSCKDMGADDDFMAKGETEEQVMQKMIEHAQSEHPNEWAEMQQRSEEEKNKMIMDMQSKIHDV